jgi:hypothetical protein
LWSTNGRFHHRSEDPRTMKPIDWIVMFAWLAFIVGYGLYRGRGITPSIVAGRQVDALVRHGAIHNGHPGQRRDLHLHHWSELPDGMRFVQFYFGLPLAMVILSATAVPIFIGQMFTRV